MGNVVIEEFRGLGSGGINSKRMTTMVSRYGNINNRRVNSDNNRKWERIHFENDERYCGE